MDWLDPFFDDFFSFWGSMTLAQSASVLWYFLIFDFGRYVLLELLTLGRIYLKRIWSNHTDKVDSARRQLREENPLVSIIVPGKNEGRHIPRLARSLQGQSWKNLEIIVVDDGSDDNTPEICRRAYKEGIIDHFFRNDVRGGKASAANLAWRYSKGKYIVHLDADSHLSDDAVEELILPFYMDDQVGAVGGDVRVANIDDSLATSMQALEYSKTIAIARRVMSALGLLRIISGACGAFKRDLLERTGGWDIGPGLDGDITLKARKLGYKVVFQPHAVCYTNVPQTMKKIAKQRFRWDKSFVRFRLRKHFDLMIPNKNFRWRNFLTVMDNFFFNLVLSLNWFVYITQIFVFYTDKVQFIILMNYFLYVVSNYLQFFVYLALTPRDEMTPKFLFLFFFVPLQPLYTGFFLRMVRGFSYFMEFFFRSSYKDPWNPWKVSKVAKDKGM
jgi:cellulose synthase/poly-beta-1,6-N-acetylglucosamine synthase-like glycosyltransferase